MEVVTHEPARWVALGAPVKPRGRAVPVARGKKKRHSAALDPLGAEQPTNAGTGRVKGIDFDRAHWIMRRAQRLIVGDAWIEAVRQAEAEWCLVLFLTGGWR